MPAVRSFRPAAGPRPRALILGSMPGAASLAAGEYYAHPRNSFWRIIRGAFAGGAELSYRARLRLLAANGIALWDVLASCVRPGSSDAAITAEQANDLPAFLAARPTIKVILFNGSKAESSYRRRVLPLLPPARGIKYRRLPSTSPAHASVPYSRKLAAWKKALLFAKRADI